MQSVFYSVRRVVMTMTAIRVVQVCETIRGPCRAIRLSQSDPGPGPRVGELWGHYYTGKENVICVLRFIRRYGSFLLAVGPLHCDRGEIGTTRSPAEIQTLYKNKESVGSLDDRVCVSYRYSTGNHID